MFKGLINAIIPFRGRGAALGLQAVDLGISWAPRAAKTAPGDPSGRYPACADVAHGSF